MFKKIIQFLGIILVLSTVAYCGTCVYVDSHKEELIKQFEAFFATQCNGSIHFSDISVSSWTKFPSVIFEVKDLNFNSFNVEKHKEETIKTKDAIVKISMSELLRKQIQIKSIYIKDAEVSLITNIDTTATSIEQQKPATSQKELPLHKKTALTIDNMQLLIINHQKGKKYSFNIKKIESLLRVDDTTISGSVDINTIVSDLTFNTKNGSFFNGAAISGTIKPTIDFQDNKVTIPFFDLQIDEQLFNISSEINMEGAGSFVFTLENNKTDYLKSVGLVSQNIQKKLTDYSVKNPIYTYTTLTGSFAPKSNPHVEIKFDTKNNSANIKDKVPLEQLGFSGKFINRIYDDERSKTESPKNVRLLIDSLNAQYKGLDFQLQDASLVSTPEVKTGIQLKLTAQGDPKKLNNVLGNDTFFFEDGLFDIQADIRGDATYIDNLLQNSTLSFDLKDSNILNPKTDLSLPIKKLSLDYIKEKTKLNTFQIDLPSGDHIAITGVLSNLQSLVHPDLNNKTTSDIKIYSKKLIWEDFTTIIQATKNKGKPKHTLQETLKDLYLKFNPKVHVNICLLYTSPSPRDLSTSRMPSSA